MNKKIIFVVLSFALVAVVGIRALMSTWNSCTITMHAGFMWLLVSVFVLSQIPVF